MRMSHRGSVLGPGQEKSLSSSHLCQKLQCLSSQSQEASAPGVCTGGLLVLPTPWGSQGWHKDSCRCRSGTGAVALWSHFKGVIMDILEAVSGIPFVAGSRSECSGPGEGSDLSRLVLTLVQPVAEAVFQGSGDG
ncbi:uncharacterized protein LOC144246509 [Lonchura striata]